ncbi:MAG: DMT family transporter [Paracoccaceae bacterium]
MQDLDYRRGVLFIVMAGVLWSLNGLLLRMIGDVGTWPVLFYRSLGMVPAITLWMLYSHGGRALSAMRARGWPSAICALALVFAFAGGVYSMQATTIANAVFIFAAAPLITAALAGPVLGEAVRLLTWLAIAIAAIGIFIMVRSGLEIGHGLGEAAALMSATGFSIFTLTLRRARLSDMMPSVGFGGAITILVALFAVYLRDESLMIPLKAAAISMLMGAGTIVGGMILFTIGTKSVPAAEAGLLALLEVLLAPVWVWLFWNEQVAFETFVGGGLLLASLVLNAATGVQAAYLPRRKNRERA